MYTVDIINVYNLPDVAQGKKDKGRFILKCSNLQKLTPECIHFFFFCWLRFVSQSLYSPVCVPSQWAVNPICVTAESERNLTHRRLLWDTKTGGLVVLQNLPIKGDVS